MFVEYANLWVFKKYADVLGVFKYPGSYLQIQAFSMCSSMTYMAQHALRDVSGGLGRRETFSGSFLQ